MAVACAGCSFGNEFACRDAGECALRPGGACEADGWCSYPSDGCMEDRAYGPYAPAGVANSCVDPEPTGMSGSSTSGVAESSTGGGEATTLDTSDASTTTGDVAAVCGNGIIEEGESCDDGNDLPDDGCHPLCVEPYDVAWRIDPWDGSGGDDRGFALDVDSAGDAVYVAGITSGESVDRLLQRYRLSDGELVWTWAPEDSPGEDRGEQVDVDAEGNIVIGGYYTDGVERAWLAAFAPDQSILWEHTDAVGSKAEGIAIAPDGRIIAVGRAGPEGASRGWLQWFSAEGQPDGDATVFGTESGNRGIDVVAAAEGGFVVTGSFAEGAGSGMWTARYGQADILPQWEDTVLNTDGGSSPRGVGVVLDPSGGVAAGGVVGSDMIVQFYDEVGERTERYTHGTSQHDEVADVVFLDDGRYVVAGFVGFTDFGAASSDGRLSFHAPDGEEIEVFTVSGTKGGASKLLAVENAPYSVVVTGYVTNEDTDIDLWLRRYAI